MLRSAECVLRKMLDTCLLMQIGEHQQKQMRLWTLRFCVKDVAVDDADRSKSMGRFLLFKIS